MLTSSYHADESIRRIVAKLQSTEKFIPFLIEIARRSYSVSSALNQSFYVSQEAMEKFFLVDDFTKVKGMMPCPIYIIDNNSINKAELKRKAASFAKKIQLINLR